MRHPKNQFPEAETPGIRASSLAAFNPHAQFGITDTRSQPLRSLPVAGGENASHDQIPVMLPGKGCEGVVPEETGEFLGQATLFDNGTSAFFHCLAVARLLRIACFIGSHSARSGGHSWCSELEQ